MQQKDNVARLINMTPRVSHGRGSQGGKVSKKLPRTGGGEPVRVRDTLSPIDAVGGDAVAPPC